MEQEKPHIMELITQAPWREAVTYRDTWPHEYVLINQDAQKALLDEFCGRITRGEGVYCHFFHQTRPYLFLGDYKYWIMTDVADADPSVGEVVLNRALLYKDRRDFLIRRGDTGRREEQIDMVTRDESPEDAPSYREFFGLLLEDLWNQCFFDGTSAEPLEWQLFLPSGFKDIIYIASLEDYEDLSGAFVTLRIDKCRESNNRLTKQLREHEQQIEKKLNVKLTWDTKANQHNHFVDIYAHREGSTNPSEGSDEVREWMRDTILKFKEVFNPRLEKILDELE